MDGSLCGRASTLDSSESLVALIEDSVDATKHDVSQYIHVHVATALDTTVGHAISGISEAQGLLADGVLMISDSDSDDGEVRSSSVGGESPALLA